MAAATYRFDKGIGFQGEFQHKPADATSEAVGAVTLFEQLLTEQVLPPVLVKTRTDRHMSTYCEGHLCEGRRRRATEQSRVVGVLNPSIPTNPTPGRRPRTISRGTASRIVKVVGTVIVVASLSLTACSADQGNPSPVGALGVQTVTVAAPTVTVTSTRSGTQSSPAPTPGDLTDSAHGEQRNEKSR